LDPINTDLLKSIMLEIRNEGKTVIFSTHVMHQAEKLCDSILLINKGQAILDDRLANIQSQRRSHIVSVEIDGNTGFIKNLPMVKAMESDGNQLDITLVEDGDSQELLRLITEQTHMQRFEVKVPSLHEIFVELVGKGNE
jgi:ABC-2 type transport system ATP-binding protein